MSKQRVVVVLGAAVTSTVIIVVVRWMYRNVSRYGIGGTLRYIWEGDPYAAVVRAALDKLEAVETSLAVHESMLELIEESLDRGRLNSVDGVDEVAAWIVEHAPANLEKDLGQVSHALDGTGAKVDSVLSSLHPDIKQLKKSLSDKLVCLMNRADALIALYKREETQIRQ